MGISVEIGLGHLGQPGHVLSRTTRSDPLYKLSGSDPDWIMWDVKLRKTQYRTATADATVTFVFLESYPLFAMIFFSCKYTESHNPYFCVHMYATITFTACTEPCPLIHCSCKTPRVLPCSMPVSAKYVQLVQSHFHLYEPHSCVWKLTGSNTHWSIEISICYHVYSFLYSLQAL